MKAIWVLAVAIGLGAAAPASAQRECEQVPESMRARCEEALRIKQACAGLKGEARKTCQQKTVQYGNLKEDCSKLAGEARANCVRDNAALDKTSPCSGKTGAELDACLKAELTKPSR